MDCATVERWLARAGFACAEGRDGAVKLVRTAQADAGPAELPPLYMQLSENWLLLSMLPMIAPDAFVPENLNVKLLAANREMRVAKFALDGADAVVLCAELPTESLDESELDSALDRIVEYGTRFDGGRGLL